MHTSSVQGQDRKGSPWDTPSEVPDAPGQLFMKDFAPVAFPPTLTTISSSATVRDLCEGPFKFPSRMLGGSTYWEGLDSTLLFPWQDEPLSSGGQTKVREPHVAR